MACLIPASLPSFLLPGNYLLILSSSCSEHLLLLIFLFWQKIGDYEAGGGVWDTDRIILFIFKIMGAIEISVNL